MTVDGFQIVDGELSSLCCVYHRPFDYDTEKSGPWRCPKCNHFERVPIATILRADTLWGYYIVRSERLPCGHDAVCWYGWKQDFNTGPTTEYCGLSLQLSLESHVMLVCSTCSMPQGLGTANDHGAADDIRRGRRQAELCAALEALAP